MTGTQLALPGVTEVTATALHVADGVDFDTCVAAAARLLPVASAAPWWVGDLIVTMELRWGQTDRGMAMVRREIVEVTNLDPQTLERMRHMAVLVPPERRREELSYSHHVEVSRLDADDQVRLLARAVDGEVDPVTSRRHRWPVERLRREVRALLDARDGDGLPELPPPTRPLRVRLQRDTVCSALPALVDAVRVLPAGPGRAAVMELVEVLEREVAS